MEQQQENEQASSQILVVVGTILVSAIILTTVWLVRNGGIGVTPTPVQATEIAGEDWPTVAPTFTPQLSTDTPIPIPTSTSTPVPPTPSPVPSSTPTPTQTPTLTPTPRILDVRELGYLTSVEFSASTIVELVKERKVSNPTPLGSEEIIVGQDRILLETVGTIKFGIDMTEVKTSDVKVVGNDVSIILPHAKVIGVELQPGRTKIYDAERSWLLSEYEGLETEAQEKAKMQLSDWASAEASFISIAEKMARLQLEDFLRTMNFESIEISFEKQGM